MPRKIDLAEAKQKAGRFCAFQERSPKEVADKLKSWGLSDSQIQEASNQLIKEGLVDQQRFANAFCHDKFEFNSWGKQKIKAQIFIHQLDSEVVQNGINRIDEEEYYNRLLELARKKWGSLSDEDTSKRKQKTLAYLGNKGFESDLIWKTIDVIVRE